MQRKIITRTVPLFAMAVTVALGIVVHSIQKENPDKPLNYSMVVGIALFMFLSAGVIIYATSKRVLKQLRTFTIIIGNSNIVREQQGLQVLEIQFSEVTEITKVSNAFVIKGKGKQDLIGTYPGMENNDRLEALLSQIKLIDSKTSIL